MALERAEGIRGGRGGLEGSTVAAGEASRARLGRLLGVEALRKRGARVAAAAWVNDHLEVEVAQPSGAPLVFLLERRREGRPCFLELGELALFYRGDEIDQDLDAAVRAVAPRAFSRATLEALAELVARDPGSGRAGEPVPAPDPQGQQDYDERALLSTWGSSAVWTSFFATAEVARSQLDSLDFFNRCTFVQHCDQECLSVSPQTGVPMVPVVLYPWDDRLRRIDWRDRAPRQGGGDGPGMVTTDLDEGDVVLGRGPAKLDAVLGDLGPRVKGDMAFCSCTCVPVVAGEDVESVVARHRAAFPVPLLFLTTTPQSMAGVFRQLLVERRLAAEARAPAPPPRTVNLIGFPKGPPLDELVDLLGLVGVSVVTTLLPALSPEGVERLTGAGLDVFHPNELWRGLYDQIRFDSKRRAVEPAAPYGVGGTLRWLAAVAREAGSDVDVEAALAPRVEAVAPRLEAWREAARGLRVGLVLRLDEAHLVTDPAKTWGMPLVATLVELGLGVDLLVHAEEAEAEAVEALAEGLGPGVRALPFATREELSALLERSGLSAVYSEHFYDRRLAERGIPSFSGQVLEHGLEGALRAGTRLLEICRTPFFSRYGRFLRRAAADRGLPDPLGPDEEAAR